MRINSKDYRAQLKSPDTATYRIIKLSLQQIGLIGDI